MNLHLARYLSCPIIRPATSEDAAEIAKLYISTDSEKIAGIFRDNLDGANKVLTNQFTEFYEGVYVLTDGGDLIGAMKIHLPGRISGKTLSLRSLISILGWKKGLRAGLLLGSWDEYELRAGEAYLEFLYVDPEWQGYGGGKLLINKAIELSTQSKAEYLSLYSATYNYKARGLYEGAGFIIRRKMFSPVAKLLGANASWVKQCYFITEAPKSIREHVSQKIAIVKATWKRKRSDVIAATRLTLAMTLVPVIGAIIAYQRGYPWSVMFWIVIGIFHLISIKLLLQGSILGKVTIVAAMLPEGINIMNRSIETDSWFTRSWLFPLSLLDLWIMITILAYPNHAIERIKPDPASTVS